MDDNDLRDRFGDELTDALRSRSRPVEIDVEVEVDPVVHRIDRARARRRILAAVIAAAVGAGATAVIALRAHDTARVNVAAGPSTTISNPPSFKPLAAGVADWTWVSADHGWVLVRNRCGANVCMVLRETTDGGRRWATVRTPELLDTNAVYDVAATCATNLCVSGVRFATPKIGWMFGPALVETADGGRTWTRVPGPDVTDIEASGNIALRLTTPRSAACEGTCSYALEREELGTGSWQRVSTPISGSPSLLILRTDAYVVDGSELRRSHDSGATWTPVPDPCGRADHTLTSASEAPDGVFVVLCSAREQPASSFIRVSGDGARTFGLPLDVPIRTVGVVRAASAQTVLIGDGTGVTVSSDGGATWHTTLTASPAPGSSIALGWENPETARASFDTDAIWTTRDAGRTWTEYAVTP